MAKIKIIPEKFGDKIRLVVEKHNIEVTTIFREIAQENNSIFFYNKGQEVGVLLKTRLLRLEHPKIPLLNVRVKLSKQDYRELRKRIRGM